MHTSVHTYTHIYRNTLFMDLDDGMTRTDVVALSIIQQQRSTSEQEKNWIYNFKDATSHHFKPASQSVSESVSQPTTNGKR